MLADALGPLAADVTVERLHDRPSTAEPDRHAAVARPRTARVAKVRPDATLLPRVTAGGTDATFFRDAGSVAYGFGLLSPAVTLRGLLVAGSTATTSASTSSRCGSRPSAGSTCAVTFLG